MRTKGIFSCPECGSFHWVLAQTSKNFVCVCAYDKCKFAMKLPGQFKFPELNEKSASAQAL